MYVMDISNWTVDDFVLNAEFRKWVLSPTSDLNVTWEKRINAYPEKLKEIKLAQSLLINFPTQNSKLTERDKQALWERIDHTTEGMAPVISRQKVIPLNSQSTIKRMDRKPAQHVRVSQEVKIAAILLVSFGLSILAATFLKREQLEPEIPLVYVEYTTPMGVKSTFLLPDSSTVMLNAGSRVRYQEHFAEERREIYLEGEAYFDVTEDVDRPFVVHTGPTSTTALGTSFTIQAYREKPVNIYLLSGKVLVAVKERTDAGVFLAEGETVSFTSGVLSQRRRFDPEKVTAWTQGIILFDETPIREAIATMEQWYGVTFRLENDPPANLRVSGKFDRELLKNILTGLGYSARFEFEILGDTISVTFNKQ